MNPNLQAENRGHKPVMPFSSILGLKLSSGPSTLYLSSVIVQLNLALPASLEEGLAFRERA